MPKMIALKKFHYPSGVHGKMYEPGDEIEVDRDRDAKALRMLKVARDAPGKEPGEAVEKPMTAEKSEASPPSRTYKRTDLTPEPTNPTSEPVAPMTTKTTTAIVPGKE